MTLLPSIAPLDFAQGDCKPQQEPNLALSKVECHFFDCIKSIQGVSLRIARRCVTDAAAVGRRHDDATPCQEAGMSGEMVLVTGGSGFIGIHCLLKLLNAGYRVRTTVRLLDREAEVRAMLKTGGAEPRETLSFAAAA
jgi:hypothetical protein